MQDITMGNQQERLSDFEIGWLAGILDGEGYISLSVNTTHRSIYPCCKIASVDEPMISKIKELLDRTEIEYGFYIRKPKNGNAISYTIDVRTVKRIKKLLSIVLPHLVTKKPNAEIALRFSDIRLSLPYGHPYTEEELQLLKEAHKHTLHKGPKRIHNDYTPGRKPRYIRKI